MKNISWTCQFNLLFRNLSFCRENYRSIVKNVDKLALIKLIIKLFYQFCILIVSLEPRKQRLSILHNPYKFHPPSTLKKQNNVYIPIFIHVNKLHNAFLLFYYLYHNLLSFWIYVKKFFFFVCVYVAFKVKCHWQGQT